MSTQSKIALLLARISKASGYSLTKEDAIIRGKRSYMVLDYNRYGGYQLASVWVDSGGHHSIFNEDSSSNRRKAAVFVAYLEGLANGLEAKVN